MEPARMDIFPRTWRVHLKRSTSDIIVVGVIVGGDWGTELADGILIGFTNCFWWPCIVVTTSKENWCVLVLTFCWLDLLPKFSESYSASFTLN